MGTTRQFITTMLISVILLSGSLFATALNESFENTTFPPAGWSVVNNGDTNGWYRYQGTGAHSGLSFAFVNYSASAHDDWMISPQLSPKTGDVTFSFWGRSAGPTYLDRFNVKLSTGGNATSDFTVTLASNIQSASSWTQYTYNLSAYAGQKVHIAVQAISTNMSGLMLDDVAGPSMTGFEGFETGDLSAFDWNNSDWIPWTVQSSEKYSGTYAAQSGALANDYERSTISISVTGSSAGYISFARKVSGDSGYYLAFAIDGAYAGGVMFGDDTWTQQSYYVGAGDHTFEWFLQRTESGGSGTAWLDNIVFPPKIYGTETNPFLIYTASDLNSVRNSLGAAYTGKYFKLMNDIDLTAYLAPGGEGYAAWGTNGWMPIGNGSNYFYGVFDGNNYTISNLRCSYYGTYHGLFGITGSGSIIENVVMSSNCFILGDADTGSIVGHNKGTVRKCRSAATVNIGNATTGGGIVGNNNAGRTTNCSFTGTITRSGSGVSCNGIGGIAGRNETGAVIDSCYSTGSVTGNTWNGGLVGWNNGTINKCWTAGSITGAENSQGGLVGQNQGNINNSYSFASVTGAHFIGGLVGNIGAGTITNCYATGLVTGGQKGGLCGSTGGTVNNSYWDKQTTGLTTSYGSADTYGKTTAEMKIQTTFSGWDFTTEPVWHITAQNSGYPHLSWQLIPPAAVTAVPATDITATSFTANWNSADDAVGYYIDISNYNNFSNFVPGYNGYDAGNVTSLSVTGLEAVTTYYYRVRAYNTAGTGINSNIISPAMPAFDGSGTEPDPFRIYTAAQLSAVRNYLGSANADKYFQVMNAIDLAAYLSSGAGYNNGYFWLPIGDAANPFCGKFKGGYNMISSLKINRAATDYSGLFGYAGTGSALEGIFIQIDPAGSVKGKNYTGGLAGYAEGGTISMCYVEGTVIGSINGTGGLVGIYGENGKISQCQTIGNVNGANSYTGGLVGESSSEITICYSSCAVNGDYYTGGLVGSNRSPVDISCSTADGNVSGNSYIGGLVGNNWSGSVSGCYATGNVTGGSNAGGLIGGGSVICNDSYASGDVSGSDHVGGLVGIGYSGSMISRCYAIGTVTGTTATGGLVGGGDVYPQKSYWDKQTTGQSASSGSDTSSGKTTAEMKTQSNYETWDFIQEAFNGTDEIWGINPSENGGYPFLYWQAYSHINSYKYVTQTGAGLKDGSNWANAYDNTQLQTALAAGPNEIWVAAGTYKPSTAADRTISFVMKNGVALYGGFAGTETELSQRDIGANPTILSGDIGTSGVSTDNSYHVVYNNQNGLTNNAVLDGFTIKDGYADGSYPHNSGAGIFLYQSSPAIINCTVRSNSAAFEGGGVFIFYSVPALLNCQITDNVGGGISIDGYSALTITNCTIAKNTSGLNSRGGIYTRSIDLILNNCIVWGNTSGYDGHQIYVWSGTCTLNYSCYANGTSDITLGTGTFTATNNNITSDPLFADTANKDYRLLISSPCLDTGFNDYNTLTTDIRSYARKLNKADGTAGTIDMGPFEYKFVPLSSPQNVTSVKNGSNLDITWTAVSGATGYKVYSCASPYGTFTEAATVAKNSWSVPISATKYFYYVKAYN
jgi:hypothetical protein